MFYPSPVDLSGVITWPTRTGLQALSIISPKLGSDWCVTGGFAAMIHSLGRQQMPRLTHDIDILLDFRRSPNITESVTDALYRENFKPVNTTPDGPQVRWQIDYSGLSSHIDIVIPSGSRVKRRDAAGRLMLESPAAQAVLDRADWQDVVAFGQGYRLRVSSLFGCIVSKSGALTTGESDDSRHIADLELFFKILDLRDIPKDITKNERKYLSLAAKRTVNRNKHLHTNLVKLLELAESNRQ